MHDVVVVLSFFSPANYEIPKKHFHLVLQTLIARGVRVVVSQAVLPGQEPQPVPEAVQNLVYEVPHQIWLKESLWNNAARNTDAAKLIFVDTDVVFSTEEWVDRAAWLLDQADIIQPMDFCRWLDFTGRQCNQKISFAHAAATRQPFHFARIHPGFSWGMTRKAFDELGGFYDLNVTGGNDTAFALAIVNSDEAERARHVIATTQEPTLDAESFLQYRANALSHRHKLMTVRGVTAVHLWHGDISGRAYTTRSQVYPRLENNDYPVKRLPNGLLAWEDEAGVAAAVEHWKNRKEDG